MLRAACLLLCVAAFGEQLPIRIYTTADGLAGNIIDRIVRDSRGYLWFCTREGLSRYDGYRFRSFGVEQGLPAFERDLLETPSGDYWIATGDGLARFRPADPNPHFTIFHSPDPLARGMNVLAADPAGGIWAGSTAGLYHLDPPHPPASNEWVLRQVDIGLPKKNFEDSSVEALLVDHLGTLWIGLRSGLYRRLPGGRSEGTSGGPPHPVVTALLEDKEGRLWAGTRQGVCKVKPDAGVAGKPLQDVCVPVPDLKGEVIYFLHESADGVLWAGSYGLLRAWGPGISGTARYSAVNGLPGKGTPMLAAADDLAGNLWVSGFGAIRIARGGFRTYSEQDGLRSGYIKSIFEDRKGELCVLSQGADGRMLNRFDSKRLHPVRPDVPPVIEWGWGAGQLALQARNGEWWIPTGMGVFRFPPIFEFERLAQTQPRTAYEAGNNVYSVFEDSRGGVWMSVQILARTDGSTSANAVARRDPSSGVLHRFSDADGVPSQALATSFAEDKAGAVWIGLSTGPILRYMDGKFRALPPPAGKLAWVNAVYAGRAGRLWVGTRFGATSLNTEDADPKPVTYTTADGLASNDVKCIVEDLQGRIYLGSGHGVDRLSLSSGAPLRIRHYTAADGLARGEIEAAFRDNAGTLWFGTREGLSRMAPEPERPASPPSVFITGLRVRGTPRPMSVLGESDLRGLQLPPDQNQVEVEFGSLPFGAGETLRYQYRMQGPDSDWSPATDQRIITYANLAPGGYRWQVRALTADGVPSERPATLELTILPPIWQRWWLRMLASILACAILYTVYHYRVDRLLEMERLRTRIATDLHDDIGSTLSQIAILSEVAQRQPLGGAREQPLEDIAGLSRELVDSMSDIVWAIDPDQDRLGDLTHRMRRLTNDLFSHNGVRIHFQAPGAEQDLQIDADVRRQVFLVFKEALHNMARHSRCGEVDIRIELEGGWLRLTLADNGNGFDIAQVRRGHGLASMTQRATQMGGSLTVQSSPGRGATLQLRVPVGRRTAAFRPKTLHKWIGAAGRRWRMLKDRNN